MNGAYSRAFGYLWGEGPREEDVRRLIGERHAKRNGGTNLYSPVSSYLTVDQEWTVGRRLETLFVAPEGVAIGCQ